MKKIFLAILCLSVVLGGCSIGKKDSNGTPNKDNGNFKVGKVNYKKCSNFLCASIKVPLDYKKPKGRKIDIALRTLSAAVPSKRKGIMLINPGGPGGSGVDFVQYASSLISPEILDSFDIVGWDPRGVGQSTKLKCTSANLDYLFDGIDYSPDNETELTAMLDVNKKVGQDCVNTDKDLAKHLTSIEATRDMDEIRQALNEKQLNYLGYSYGTVLGQIYATLFPKNYRTIILDGVVDVGANPLTSAGDQGIGFSNAFDSFFNYCKETICKYANGEDPKTVYSRIASEIDANPIVSDDGSGSTLGTAQFDLGTGVYLYGGIEEWPSLDDALSEVELGDSSGIINGYNSYLGRDYDGTYDGSYMSFLSILCSDGKLASGDDLYSFAKEIGIKAPLIGEAVVLFGIQCSYWPNVGDAKAFKVNNSKGNSVLVIGTTGDPATPVQASRDVAKKLQHGSLLEFKGEGHTAYGRSNNCVSETVDKYILTGVASKKTTYC